MEKLKAVAYCRVSTTKEEQDLSLENQKQDIINHIENNGFNWELTKIYSDRSSATSIHGRKGYKQMMSDLRKKEFDIVVIKDVSRLNRNIDNFTSFCTKLEENNIKLYLLLSGAMYSNENRLITNVYAAFSEEVSRNLSKKINHATKSRQKKGRVITNNKMWGYIQENASLKIRENEAKVIKKVFQLYIAGYGFRSIGKMIKPYLDDEIRERRNIDTIPPTTLKRMIKQEKYFGRVVGNKKHKEFGKIYPKKNDKQNWIIVDNACPAIIDKETWIEANDILKSKSKKFNGTKKGIFVGNNPLSRKLFCGKCNSPLWYDKNYSKNRKNVWTCKNVKINGRDSCPDSKRIDAYIIEKTLKENLFNTFIKDKGFIKKILNIITNNLKTTSYDDEIKRIKSEIKKYEKRLLSNLNNLNDGIISKDDFNYGKKNYESKLNELYKNLENFENRMENDKDHLKKLKEMEVDFNNKIKSPEDLDLEIVVKLIDKVIVNDLTDIRIVLSPAIKSKESESIQNILNVSASI